MLVEAGCVTFDDLPPVARLEYSIDHADVYLSEDAAERLLLPLCDDHAGASALAAIAAGAAVVAFKGFSAAAAAAITKFAQMGVAVIPVPFDGGDPADDSASSVFDERDVTWEVVSWEQIKADGLLMIMCDKMQSEGLYLARHYAQQQQHPSPEPNMFPQSTSAAQSPPGSVAFKILISGRAVALAAPFSFVIPLASTSPSPPPSPVVAYLAASCARARDLLQLLSLLTCGADVFGSMSALSLISDAMCDADDAAAGGDNGLSQGNGGILCAEDVQWLLCAASAWALDSGQGACDSSSGSYTSSCIITACLQSSDILNDLCTLPFVSIQVTYTSRDAELYVVTLSAVFS